MIYKSRQGIRSACGQTLSRIIDLWSGYRLTVESQNDNIAAKCRRTPPFVGFERHYSLRMSSIPSGTGMTTCILVPYGLS